MYLVCIVVAAVLQLVRYKQNIVKFIMLFMVLRNIYIR